MPWNHDAMMDDIVSERAPCSFVVINVARGPEVKLDGGLEDLTQVRPLSHRE